VANLEALKTLRDERAAIAREAEELQTRLMFLKDRLRTIDAAIGKFEPPKPESRARWGSAAYRRKQLL
jgi:hypothetical protein